MDERTKDSLGNRTPVKTALPSPHSRIESETSRLVWRRTHKRLMVKVKRGKVVFHFLKNDQKGKVSLQLGKIGIVKHTQAYEER